MHGEYRVCVVSGGGIRGLALLGALHALCGAGSLERARVFVGTSVGAMICFLLIIGYSPCELLRHVVQNNVFGDVERGADVGSFLRGGSLLPHSVVLDHLSGLAAAKGVSPGISLRRLREYTGKTLVTNAYNIDLQQHVFFGPDSHPDMRADRAILMSSSVPILFEPVDLDGGRFVDGGLVDNFPIQVSEQYLAPRGEAAIGVTVPMRQAFSREHDTLLGYLFKLLFTPISFAMRKKTERLREKLGARVDVIELEAGAGKPGSFSFGICASEMIEMFWEGAGRTREVLGRGRGRADGHQKVD